MEDSQAALIAEQFSHAVDLLKSDLKSTKADNTHQKELFEHRLTQLENKAADFEVRIRALTESSTQFKLLVSLAAGGGLLSLISLIRTLLGG